MNLSGEFSPLCGIARREQQQLGKSRTSGEMDGILNYTEKLTYIWGHSITTWTRLGGEGVKKVCFCPCRGGGVKKWQISVHVVVECPLMPVH